MNRDLQSPRRRGLGTAFGFLAAPPPVKRIVDRAHVFCALQLRAELEGNPDRADAAALVATLRDWLADTGAQAELEAPERALLAADLGTLEEPERERAGWLGEAAVVLGWALRCVSLPSPGKAAEASAVAESLGFLSADPTPLHTRARLRPRAELLAVLELLRLVESRLHQALTAPEAVSLASWRGASYAWPEDVQPFEFAAEDLAIDGQPLAAVPAPRLLSVWRAAHERRRAAAWLLGAAPRYAEVEDGSAG